MSVIKNEFDQSLETAEYLKKQVDYIPEYAIVLGSGLGSLVEDIEVEKEIPYKEIPNFPVSTVKGHKGSLIFGTLNGKKVLAMNGRFHFYEGYSMKQVTFPERVFWQMGIRKLIVSNASGGVNRNYKVGDVMLIKDHVNFFPEHPLRGPNDKHFGPRFVNMSEPYSKKMLQVVREYATNNGIKIKEGTYLGLQGPTFETLAEYTMVRNMGADAVGMSTVPEVIVAVHMGMEVFGISVITDIGTEEFIEEVNHQEVLKAARAAEPVVRELVGKLVELY